MIIVYKSKTSLLIKLLFFLAILILLLFSITEKSWGLCFVAISFAVIALYIFSTTYYTVYKNKLTIKSGFLFNEKIDINMIKKVKSLRKNIFSGPGFSAHRLLINYNDHDCVIISPNLQQTFIDHLTSINPDIVIEN